MDASHEGGAPDRPAEVGEEGRVNEVVQLEMNNIAANNRAIEIRNQEIARYQTDIYYNQDRQDTEGRMQNLENDYIVQAKTHFNVRYPPFENQYEDEDAPVDEEPHEDIEIEDSHSDSDVSKKARSVVQSPHSDSELIDVEEINSDLPSCSTSLVVNFEKSSDTGMDVEESSTIQQSDDSPKIGEESAINLSADVLATNPRTSEDLAINLSTNNLAANNADEVMDTDTTEEVLATNVSADENKVSDEQVTTDASKAEIEDAKSIQDDDTMINENADSDNKAEDASKDESGSPKRKKRKRHSESNRKRRKGSNRSFNGKDSTEVKTNEDDKDDSIKTDDQVDENFTNVNGSSGSKTGIKDCEAKIEEAKSLIDKMCADKTKDGSSRNKRSRRSRDSKTSDSDINGDGKACSSANASGEFMERVIIISKAELKEAIIPIAKPRGERTRSSSRSSKKKSPSKSVEPTTRTSSRTKSNISSLKRTDENVHDNIPAKREQRKVTFDSNVKSDSKPRSSSRRNSSASGSSSKGESKDGASSSSKNEKSKDKTKEKSNAANCEMTADSTTKKIDDTTSSSHTKRHRSSRRSSRDHHSSHSRRHSSHCRSLKDDGKCDCRKRRHGDREKHESRRNDREKSASRRSSHEKEDNHRSSRSSKHSRKHDRLNFKQQVNVSELHNHSAKQTKTDPKSGEPAFRLHPRVPWTPHETIARFKHQELFRIETDVNGGATTCHLYYDEISHLPEEIIKEIAEEFIMLSYSEDENENAHHVMGIVHGGADYLPDLLDYMADHYPMITVKTGSLTGRATQSITMGQYRDEAYRTYSNGTFRYAPLQELSICGVQGEEVGAYFPDFVKRLEKSCHMLPVMPWSYFSVVSTDNPRESNDGPIFWIRPGEQTLPASDSTREKGRLAKGVSRLSEAREALFEDRTKPHADQIGVDGGSTDTAPTAAVGLLKAVNCGHADHGGRATKDVVAFHAEDYNALLDILQIDVYEPPLRQCTMWLETAKLNSLRRQGVRYSKRQLHDGDVYYLPRKVIHQFQTISSVASVAWHVRFLEYFKTTGAPNLHAPTGLNKGSVYFEKTEVPPYFPPKPEEPEEEVLLVKSPRKRRRRSEGEGKNEVKKKVKKEKIDEKKKKAATPQKVPALVIKTGQPSGSSDVPKPASPEKVPKTEGEKEIKPVEPVKTDAHVVSPIKLEKSGTNSFCVVNKTTDSATSKKILRQNMPFKKRKTPKIEDSCDVLGDIMSQMKKSKTD